MIKGEMKLLATEKITDMISILSEECFTRQEQ